MRRLLLLPCLFLLATPSISLAADACCFCRRPNDTEKTCLTKAYSGRAETETEACEGLVGAVGLAKDGWVCDPKPVENCEARPKGVCSAGPISAFQLKEGEAPTPKIGATESQTPTPAIIPKLNTPIPGFEFEPPQEGQNSLLAQYLSAAYRYGISIAAIAATIMFIFGAFQYLIGSAITSIQNGKTIMQEAILGMVLIFSAVAILRVINPELQTLPSLAVDPIQAIALENENVADAGLVAQPNASATPSVERGTFISWNAEELTGAERLIATPNTVAQPLEVPVFKQSAGPWANRAFGPQGVRACPSKNDQSFAEAQCCTTYLNSGCGAASLATLLAFNGVDTDPGKTGEALVAAGLRTCNKGTSFGKDAPQRLKSLTGDKTLTALGGGKAGTQNAITALRNGQPVMFLCSSCSGKTKSGGSRSYKGHYMVLTGVNADGQIFTVSDVGRSDHLAMVSISQPELAKRGAAFWALQ